MREQDYFPLIKRALDEDLGSLGDVTSRAIFSDESGEMYLVSKAGGILAGIEVFKAVYREVDTEVTVGFFADDGAELNRGDHVATVAGRIASILTGERTAINFLSLMSGIATDARCYVKAARERGKAEVLDTRKTLPGYRAISKYAARIGGVRNHRMGLYDMVMIKDNHIDACGSIAQAVSAVRNRWGDRFQIEVECRTLEEVEEAIQNRVDVVMLDNMDVDMMKKAVEAAVGTAKLEASGGVTLDTIGEVSATGVDYISVGAITHSVRAFDFSLRKRT